MSGQSVRVLIVEDNADDAALMLRELERAGFSTTFDRVTTREDYLRALDSPYDAILADFTLPRFDALSALSLLKERGHDIPFIVVTGSVGEERAVSCMREGAADCLLKDRLVRLGPALRRVLEEKRERDEKLVAQRALSEQLEFEALLASLSTKLISARPEMLDEALSDALRVMVQAQGFDRALVLEFDDARTALSISHEYPPSAPGSETGTWEMRERVLSGEASVLLRQGTAGVTAAERALLQREGAEMLVSLPFGIEGRVAGSVLLIAKGVVSNWVGSTKTRARLVSELVASTLLRRRAELRREEAFAEVEKLRKAAELERDYLRQEVREDLGFGRIIGSSPALREVLSQVDAVADTRASVLIRGESGVGKELVARAIHERGGRRTGPLVKVNCATIPRELFESEFFGHVKGSFTGAHKDRVGRFELATGGTIFLDELGELPQDMQAKLLRVLQEGEFERIGDDRTRRTDVRVIAATNRDLEGDIEDGTFRRDLYYRLSVFPIEVPPLRARREDILPLAEHFLAVHTRTLGRPSFAFLPEQKAALLAYDWPGNIRELQHVLERAVILSRGSALRLELPVAHQLPTPPKAEAGAEDLILSDGELRDLERKNLLRALDRSVWRISGRGGASEILGLSPSTLRDRMKALGIQRPEG
jgi:DNA-binding NtrC family response regulator